MYLVPSLSCAGIALVVDLPHLLLCVQIKDGFGEGKDLVVSVMSAMGEEQICALKDIGPK